MHFVGNGVNITKERYKYLLEMESKVLNNEKSLVEKCPFLTLLMHFEMFFTAFLQNDQKLFRKGKKNDLKLGLFLPGNKHFAKLKK